MQVTLNNAFDIFDKKYKETPTVFKEDPLVLAVSAYHLTVSKHREYAGLTDSTTLEYITDDMRAEAEVIRKYYTKKYFWNLLSGERRQSEFRTRVCHLLENRVRECLEQDCGIYYKLPYFYQEDMIYDDFKKQYVTDDLPRIVYGGSVAQKKQLTLTFLKTSASRQKKRNVQRFWFTDNKYLYSIEVTSDNPLLDMFKQMVVEKMTVTFDTYYNVDRIDQMYFYKLFNFTIAKETNA